MIQLNESEFNRLSNYIRSNYGINLENKKNLVEMRLVNTLLERGFESFGDYFEQIFLDHTGFEMSSLVDKLTTNHTFFMRESSHYEFLRSKILPKIFMHRREKDLRIWSAGCSSGEEPYSIAMVLDDFFKFDINEWDTDILATDISTNALKKAREGVFSSAEVDKLSPAYVSKYLVKTGPDTYAINERIKKRVIFKKFNLMTKEYPFKKGFDVIFCRNVMIYFDNETKAELVRKFHGSLADGGYLFIGQTESINKAEAGLKYVLPSIYFKEPR